MSRLLRVLLVLLFAVPAPGMAASVVATGEPFPPSSTPGTGSIHLVGNGTPTVLLVDGESLAAPSAPLPWRLDGLGVGFQRLTLTVDGRVLGATVRVVASSTAEVDLSEFEEHQALGVEPGFDLDLFAFYDGLDALLDPEARGRWCTSWLDRVATGTVRKTIENACGAPIPAPSAATPELVEEERPRPETTPLHRLLYRPDGLIRQQPRGTGLRLGLAVGFGAGTAISWASALAAERRAALSFDTRRQAERHNDHRGAAEALFHAREADTERDAAIGVALGFTTALLTDLLFDAFERRRFEHARGLSR